MSASVSSDSIICSKVFAKICSDFYVERIGDRSVNFMNISLAATFTSSASTSSSTSSSSSITDSNLQYNLLVGKLDKQIEKVYEEFFSRIKEGVVHSFYQRCGQYDSDIRRLDSFRGSPQFDFRQLFLVKESLALMYQLMQLPQVFEIQHV